MIDALSWTLIHSLNFTLNMFEKVILLIVIQNDSYIQYWTPNPYVILTIWDGE